MAELVLACSLMKSASIENYNVRVSMGIGVGASTHRYDESPHGNIGQTRLAQLRQRQVGKTFKRADSSRTSMSFSAIVGARDI